MSVETRGRGRGRPRKYGDLLIQAELYEDPPEDDPRPPKSPRTARRTSAPLQEIDNNVRRRPGRPRGSKNKQTRPPQPPQSATRVDRRHTTTHPPTPTGQAPSVPPPGRPQRQPEEPSLYKIARREGSSKHVVYWELPPLLHQDPCPHCGALLWPGERPSSQNKRTVWLCCQNNQVNIDIPDAPPDEPGPNASQRDEAIHGLDRIVYDTVDIDGVTRLTDKCKEFRKNILSYNNALAWASEGVDKVDRAVGHYNFRLQGELRHFIGGLIPRQGEDPKFAMIYCIDGSQQQLDARLFRHNLHSSNLRELQSILKQCNPFATAFRTCLDRQQAHPHSSQARIVLNQLDPRRTNRGTHNKPTSDEVAAVVSGLNNLDGRSTVERDIVVQTHSGVLQRVPFWHSSYMALRYPLIFPYGEVSWQKDIALASYNRLPDDHLLAHRNRIPGTLYNHGQQFEPEAPAEEDIEPNNDESARSNVKRGRGGTVRITSRAWYRKAIQRRRRPGGCPDQWRFRPNRIHRSGPLQLRFLTDAWSCCELNNLNYLRTHQQTLRVDKYSAFEDCIHHDDNVELREIGKERVVLPSSFYGGPRSMKMKMQDCLALVRRYGKPDFLITFTCNPSWPEVVDCVEAGLGTEAYVDISARVFKLKLDELLKDLFKKDVLGKSVAHAYVIEFQKRGLPHAHILLMLRPEDRLTSPEDVDHCISAEIPDEAVDRELFQLVTKHMMHGRCDDKSRTHKCTDPHTNKCSKHFPKEYIANTSYSDPEGGYPKYRRRERGPISDTDSRDNQWVVPYNPWLLKKYQAHLNVEACFSVKSVQYLYKYIYKGATAGDFSLHEVHGDGDGDQAPVNDEIKEYIDARWIGSAEAVWRLLELPMGEIVPPVARLDVHLPGHNTVTLNPANPYHRDVYSLDHDRLSRSKLTEWFALNRKAQDVSDAGQPIPFEKDPRQYRYDEIPEHFVWDQKKRGWLPRQRGFNVGRVFFVSPKTGDLFHLRILLNNVTGATSFEDLCTFNGHTYRKEDGSLDFLGGCRARGLCDDDNELHAVLTEAAELHTPPGVRHLFVSMLIHSLPTDPRKLWFEHRETLSKDCNYLLQHSNCWSHLLPHRHPEGSQEVAENLAVEFDFSLYLIERILEKQDGDCSLAMFNLPLYQTPFGVTEIDGNSLIHEEMSYNNDPVAVEEAWKGFNPGQLHAAQTILDAVNNPRPQGRIFFLNGAGGAGKTYVQNTVLKKVRLDGNIALAVASSGIAATLLQGGTTAHSKFKIPLDADQTSTCNVRHGGQLAQLLKKAKLIFWDEAPMQSRFDIEAVDRCLRDICNDEDLHSFFAGKVVCFCGDFRQTLPVVLSARRADCIAKCIQKSTFWKDVQILHLTENMRLSNPQLTDQQRQRTAEFAQQLLSIGNGSTTYMNAPSQRSLAHWPHGWIDGNDRGDLIRFIYPQIAQLTRWNDEAQAKYLKERAILAITNRDVDNLNDAIIDRLSGDLQIRWSTDRAISDEYNNTFPPEYWNAISQPSMAPHRLRLKVGMTIMAVRNMDPPRVCNGTRLRIVEIKPHLIHTKILTGDHIGESYIAHRILMPSKENDKRLPCPFVRKQFPIRPAFAMTINKAQGQTLKYVGIDLKSRSCFSHGQLYVALSRVTEMSNLQLIGPDRPEELTNKQLVNVVYKEVLLPSPVDEHRR